MTEKQRQSGRYYYAAWRNSPYEEIWQAYGKPSTKKLRSYEVIRSEMQELGGKGLRVLNHGCHFYSCAYILDGKLVVHTKTKRMEFELAEIR